MPIRPENRDRYPADWPAISRAIRADRAGWRCECDGRCGRDPTHLDTDARCTARHMHPSPATGATVILTVAHLDHTPEHCDPTNLAAMCQACHLNYDRDHHAASRATNLQADREAAGQETLL